MKPIMHLSMHPTRNWMMRIIWMWSAAQLTGCAVGPDYIPPVVEVPPAFKEMEGWKIAQPRDHEVRGNWWEAFNDPLLNALEERVDVSNQNLAAAEAQFRKARAIVQEARAGYFPEVSGIVSNTRSGRSTRSSNVNNTHTLQFDAHWEADVWGRIRRTVEESQANAQASGADLEATRLSIQAQLAQTYFQLRTSDAQQQLLDRTVADYQRSLQLTQNQYRAGVAARENVVLAETQLKTAQAQAIDLGVMRSQLEHAIALLLGKPPSDFALTPAQLAAAVPPVPVGVPSALLERRPDIAAAERRVAAANAGIGVAAAAYFPDLTVFATGGFQSTRMAQWLTVPSRYWSVGADIAQILFDAGARQARTDQAIADYDAEVAAYRQTVLTGFQEVEDSLAALRILEQEAQVQNEALQFSRQSVALTINQYKAGIVSYLNVITVQTTALGNERTAVDLQSRRLLACILLIKALGGGWRGQ
jgi:NodT family efflux transporter outer membrane factor (OMF) lipoprotein